MPPPPAGPEDLEGELAFDTVSFGVGNWRFYHYNRAEAIVLLRNVAMGEAWNSRGFIGSEPDLLRGERERNCDLVAVAADCGRIPGNPDIVR